MPSYPSENKFNIKLISELLGKITRLLQVEINTWEENYKNCLFLEAELKKSNINLESNFLINTVFLIELYSKFISKIFYNFLNPEAYYFMQEYLLLSHQKIDMRGPLIALQPGESIALNLADIFSFYNSNIMEVNSFYSIRSIMESTIFDLFVEYLNCVIIKAKQLQTNINLLIKLNEFDHNVVVLAKDKLIELEKIFFRINNMSYKISTENCKKFNQQFDKISSTVKSNDIFHLTFGASGNLLQIFPFIVNHKNVYAWHDKSWLHFGNRNSNYFGLHVDPFFDDFSKMSKYYEKVELNNELTFLHNSIIDKNNFYFFNEGNINLIYREHSNKMMRYLDKTNYIELSITRLKKLLEKGVILVLGSHCSVLDEEQQRVGPLRLEELKSLKQQYPNNLYIVFSVTHQLPDLMETLQNKIDDILGRNNYLYEDNMSFSFISNNSTYTASFDKDPSSELIDDLKLNYKKSKCLIS